MLALRRALLLGGLLAVAGVSTPAQAATALAGSQAVSLNANNGLSITPSGAALSAVTQFTINMVTTTGGTAQSGGFVGVASAPLTTTTMDTGSLSSFTFGSAAFGTFTASYGVEIVSPANTRTFYFTGNFTPGTDPQYAGLTGNTASFLVNMNQTGGAGSSIGFSGTLNLPGVPPPPPGIPEPTSLALASVPALLGLLSLRKRAAK